MRIKGIGTISKEKAMEILTREGRKAVRDGEITTEELGEMYKLKKVKEALKSVFVPTALTILMSGYRMSLKRN